VRLVHGQRSIARGNLPIEVNAGWMEVTTSKRHLLQTHPHQRLSRSTASVLVLFGVFDLEPEDAVLVQNREHQKVYFPRHSIAAYFSELED